MKLERGVTHGGITGLMSFAGSCLGLMSSSGSFLGGLLDDATGAVFLFGDFLENVGIQTCVQVNRYVTYDV